MADGGVGVPGTIVRCVDVVPNGGWEAAWDTSQVGRLGCSAFMVVRMVVQQYWPLKVDFERIASAECELQTGSCRQILDGALVIFPLPPIPLMQPLRLRFDWSGLAPSSIVVEFRGLNMDMGLNRNRLAQAADGWRKGETILPICSQRQMAVGGGSPR